MIYAKPAPEASIDQGDLIDACPLLRISSFQRGPVRPEKVDFDIRRVVVLTQACDLAHDKTAAVQAGEVFEAQFLVDRGLLKPSDIKGPLRSGRVWGWYFLPASANMGLPEMIVDFRRLHTVRLDLLQAMCQEGNHRVRLLSPYREHLSKHFADTYSRIGLPQPYETL